MWRHVFHLPHNYKFFISCQNTGQTSSTAANVLQQANPFPSSNILFVLLLNSFYNSLMKSQHCCKAGKYLYTDEYSSWLPVCHAKFSDVLASLQTQPITTLVTQHSWAVNTYTGFISKQFQPQPPFFAQSLNEPWANHTLWGSSVSSNNLRISVNQHHLQ